jgi:hypothetical protein
MTADPPDERRRATTKWSAFEWFEWLFVLAAVLFAIGFGLLR